MKRLIVLYISILIITVMGCSKKNSPTPVIYYPDMTPFGIAIEIIKNNINLPDSILKKTKMSYYAFGVKNYLIDFAFAKDPIDTTKNLVGTYEAYQLSSISNRLTSISFPTIPGNYVTNLITVQVPAEPVSTYYIEYPNGLKTDTVYLVTTILQGLQAVNSACGCTDPVPQKIMFNGEPASLDTALTLKGGCINCRSNVYLLAK